LTDAKAKGKSGIQSCHLNLKTKTTSLYKTAPSSGDKECNYKSNFYL